MQQCHATDEQGPVAQLTKPYSLSLPSIFWRTSCSHCSSSFVVMLFTPVGGGSDWANDWAKHQCALRTPLPQCSGTLCPGRDGWNENILGWERGELVHRLWHFLGAPRWAVNDVSKWWHLKSLTKQGTKSPVLRDLVAQLFLWSCCICKFTGEAEGLCTEDSAVLSVYSGHRIIPRASSESLQRTWAKRKPLRGSAEK